MVFQPVPNVVQLVAQYNSLGEICENVYHYSSGAAPTATTMNALIDAFIAYEVAQLNTIRNTSTALTRLTATDMGSASGVLVDRAVVPATVGTNAGTADPNNVTVAVSWRTGLRGRSFRGRTFHIGMSETLRTANHVADVAVPFFISKYTGLIVLGVAPIFTLQVVSRFSNKVKRLTGIATPVTAVTLDTLLDSQRRRLPGHNRHN